MLSSINDFAKNIKEAVNVQLPCKVTTLNEDGTVDVEVIGNDGKDDVVFPNVPVRHNETTRAYIFLGIQAGDRGLIRFCDRSIEGLKQGIDLLDDRMHAFDDGVVDLGFYPLTEAYAFPVDKTIEIGNKNGKFKLSISEDGTVDLITPVVNVDGLVNLGLGGNAIARVGDSVEVTVTGGSSAGTYSGTITSGGVNTSL